MIVLSGKDQGQRGEVVRALPEDKRVIVEGVNVAKRHTKPDQATHAGRHHRQGHADPVVAVALVCKACDGPPASATASTTDGRKVRICKKCGADL